MRQRRSLSLSNRFWQRALENKVYLVRQHRSITSMSNHNPISQETASQGGQAARYVLDLN